MENMERNIGMSREELKRYEKKKVLITGHTGFKGSWMTQMLLKLGADVVGYALMPPTEPNLYTVLNLDKHIKSVEGDIRDYEHIERVIREEKPDIVFHLAAQPIVRKSYEMPRQTYETNVMGTINVLESVRNTDTVQSVINVTTDKVYLNREWYWGYRENENLNGYDPYSNSKSCSELATETYRRSFLEKRGIAVSTMRAGNVIGGGDFAQDRIIPDCVRAAQQGKKIIVRNPQSIRPYQHVLEPITAYLMVAIRQYEDKKIADAYNVGPDEQNCVATYKLVDLFCKEWSYIAGSEMGWEQQKMENEVHEARTLKLDCSKMKEVFGWKPVWNIEKTLEETVKWYYLASKKSEVSAFTNSQIEQYLMTDNLYS